MISPFDLSPEWSHEEVGGFIRSASAIVDLGHPAANPLAPCTTLFIEIEEDEELVEFLWRFATSEEESNFGNAEYGSGRSLDLEQAKADCWDEVVIFLRGEGYSDSEISASL